MLGVEGSDLGLDTVMPPAQADLNLVLLTMESHSRLVSRAQILISERFCWCFRRKILDGGDRVGSAGTVGSLLCCFPLSTS